MARIRSAYSEEGFHRARKARCPFAAAWAGTVLLRSIRSLLELARSVLYIWSANDLIPRRPRRRLCHVLVHRRIFASHSAPELAAEYGAQALLPFLTGEKTALS